MKSLLPRVVLTSLVLGVCSAGYAQDPVPIEFYRPLKNSVSIGVRRIGGNAKVKFSNLGTISTFAAPDLTSATTRIYHNGYVGADGPSAYETNNFDSNGDGVLDTYRVPGTPVPTTDVDGNVILTTTTSTFRRDMPDGRYQYMQTVTVKDLVANTEKTTETILGDYLTYNAGETRAWGFNQPSQTTPGTAPDGNGGNSNGGTVDMSVYSATTSGGTAEAESDSSPGVELQFAHIFKRYKRFEWGVNFSAGASTINAKTHQHVRTNLITTTDRYTLNNGSKFADYAYYDSSTDLTTKTVSTGEQNNDGTEITYDYPHETEHRLGFSGTRIADGVISANGADVNGYWQIKGAYYMLRLGPIVRMPIAKNWTISAGAGGALAFVGSRFIVDEYIELPDVQGIPIRYQGEGSKKAMVPGYYADVNIERWITVRTGFFAGYSAEKMGDYSHVFNGRKAEVDLGTSTGFRFGIITRF